MRKRKHACLFYMDEKENRHFEKQLAVTGLKKSELLRKLILKTDIQPKPSEDVIQIYRLVSTIANNANQMAKIANATGYVDPQKVDGLLIMVDKCWQLMKRIRSNYYEQNQWLKRDFTFSTDGTNPDDEYSTSDLMELSTIVILSGFKEKYRSVCPIGLEVLAYRIVEHCLLYFLSEGSSL